MNRYEKITYIIILISLLIFNISFWIDHWSTSENASQGMWDLCFKSDDNGCCQSFPDRGHETPDWFVQFLWALYAAYISIAITCIICPYCVLLNEKNIEGKECMTVLLIASCFSSAICLIMALRLYGFNFKSVESLEDHNLYTSFWLTVVCVMLFSFDGLMMTVMTIKNGWCVTRCRNAPKSTSGNIELTNVSFDNANNPIQHDPEDCTHYDLEEQRQHAKHERWGNYNDTNDYNVEERRGWRGGRHGHQKEDKTHYDFVKSWWAQDEQQGYYKDFKDNDVEERRRWNAERHENQKDFRERWTGDRTNGNLKVIPLDENCYEYRTVEQSFKMNNENFRIVQIFRIENKEAYELHTSFGKTVMKKAKRQYPYSYKQYLWHGTSRKASFNINENGFNRNYNGKNACFYGEGVYFATEPSYSSNDIYSVPDENGDKFVYKCSVFVGRFGQGGKDLKEPPRDINNSRYDSAVDDVNDPKIHVMFRDNQAYPEYLIQFNRARY